MFVFWRVFVVCVFVYWGEILSLPSISESQKSWRWIMIKIIKEFLKLKLMVQRVAMNIVYISKRLEFLSIPISYLTHAKSQSFSSPFCIHSPYIFLFVVSFNILRLWNVVDKRSRQHKLRIISNCSNLRFVSTCSKWF